MRQKYSYFYKKINPGEAVLYRVFGTSPIVELPEFVGECRIIGIGAYCFSDRNRVPEGVCRYPDITSESIRELSGGYIERVILPDSIGQIDNAAFFGCRSLKTLEIGKGSLTIGSDVFNNCTSLTETIVRGRAEEASGVKQILDRISWDMEVCFENASILYPEYYESYDTIAPAHIFGLNIEGEGFRARQCFRGDVVDFAGYDSIFGKACAEESVSTLGRMALNRLMAPVGLAEPYRIAYEEYINKHSGIILLEYARKRDVDRMAFLCKNKFIHAEFLEQAIAYTVQDDWSEGTANLMEWRHQYFVRKKADRYEF